MHMIYHSKNILLHCKCWSSGKKPFLLVCCDENTTNMWETARNLVQVEFSNQFPFEFKNICLWIVLHFIKNNVFSFFYSWPCPNSWLEPNFPSILPQEPPRPPTWRAFITHMHSLWQQPKRQRHKRIIYKASKDTRSTTLGLPFPKDTSGTYYRLQNFLSTTLL